MWCPVRAALMRRRSSSRHRHTSTPQQNTHIHDDVCLTGPGGGESSPVAGTPPASSSSLTSTGTAESEPLTLVLRSLASLKAREEAGEAPARRGHGVAQGGRPLLLTRPARLSRARPRDPLDSDLVQRLLDGEALLRLIDHLVKVREVLRDDEGGHHPLGIRLPARDVLERHRLESAPYGSRIERPWSPTSSTIARPSVGVSWLLMTTSKASTSRPATRAPLRPHGVSRPQSAEEGHAAWRRELGQVVTIHLREAQRGLLLPRGRRGRGLLNFP